MKTSRDMKIFCMIDCSSILDFDHYFCDYYIVIFRVVDEYD